MPHACQRSPSPLVLLRGCASLRLRPLCAQDEFSVNIYEEVVRFHLLSEHELCEEEASSEWGGLAQYSENVQVCCRCRRLRPA